MILATRQIRSPSDDIAILVCEDPRSVDSPGSAKQVLDRSSFSKVQDPIASSTSQLYRPLCASHPNVHWPTPGRCRPTIVSVSSAAPLVDLLAMWNKVRVARECPCADQALGSRMIGVVLVLILVPRSWNRCAAIFRNCERHVFMCHFEQQPQRFYIHIPSPDGPIE